MTPREPTSTPDAPATAHARVGSLSIRYSVQGSVGRPLLLVNGLGANVEMWAPLRAALGRRRTIAFDAPGTGDSTTSPRPLTMRELAHVALGVVDALAVEEFDLLGYSFGGAVAQEIARAEPARIHRMVLAASTCGWGAPPGDPLALFALLTPARYYFGPATTVTTAFFGDGAPRDFATADAARLERPPDLLGYAWQLTAALTWSSLAWLHRVTVPTLVLCAERDRMVRPSTARLLARRLPDARLEVIGGAGHFFLLREHDDAAARAITGFLDEDATACAPTAQDGLSSDTLACT